MVSAAIGNCRVFYFALDFLFYKVYKFFIACDFLIEEELAMKKVFFGGLIFCFLLTIPAAEKVTRLGQHPFFKSKDIQPSDLKIIAVDKAGDVKMGFEEAGNS